MVRWVSRVISGAGGSGAAAWSFFLKAVTFDDPLDAADADFPAALTQFLGNHLGRGAGVQKPVANDLTNHLRRAAVLGLGPPAGALQRDGPVRLEGVKQLKIALLGVAVLEGSGRRPQPLALPFNEHGQFAGDLIVLSNGEAAGGPLELERRGIKKQHGGYLLGQSSRIGPGLGRRPKTGGESLSESN